MSDNNIKSLHEYKTAGAAIRATEHVIRKTADFGPYNCYDWDGLIRQALELVEQAGLAAERQMLEDFPHLSNEYCHIFHGSLTSPPATSTDAEVIGIAKQMLHAII